MKARFAVVVGGIGLLLAAVPVVAHHSFAAEFDAAKAIRLKGAVTKIEWMNPHTYFYMDVKEICEGAADAVKTNVWKCSNADKSAVPNWGLEMGSPNGLMRQGWTRNSMKIGEEVTVEGSRAKDGSLIGNARSVVLASTGKRMFAGSSQDNPPTPAPQK